MKLKELCEELGYKYDKKNPKRSLEEIKKDYKIGKSNNKKYDYYIINELTNSEKKLNHTNFRKYSYMFNSPYEYIDKGGVYKIQLNNDIYIGQTNNFYNRLSQHKTNSFNLKTKILLDNGGCMEVIELSDSKLERLEKETYWTNYYKKLGFNILNDETVLYHNKNKKFKNIKIESKNYNIAIKLLKKEGLL